jgi:hypothetical protein
VASFLAALLRGCVDYKILFSLFHKHGDDAHTLFSNVLFTSISMRQLGTRLIPMKLSCLHSLISMTHTAMLYSASFRDFYRQFSDSSEFIRGPFETFVDSPYYSDWELCGGTVTASFSKHLSWQTMHFLQRSTHFSKKELRSFKRSLFMMAERPWWSVSVARLKSGNGCTHRNRWSPIRTSAIQSRSHPM